MIKRIISKFMYKYRNTSDDYLKFLKKNGVEIGENIIIYYPHETVIECNNPHLLKIGSNVRLTGPVTILTHDYSVFVLNNLSRGRIFGKQKKTTIGNNVFIGWGATILAGTTIGNNVIIGANAVCSGLIESNSVYAGNPAKKIMSIDQYKEKVEKNQIKDMINIYEAYVERFNKRPPETIFHEYFQNFTNQYESCNIVFQKKMKDEGNLEENKKYLNNNKPYFKNYDEFCNYIERKDYEKKS